MTRDLRDHHNERTPGFYLEDGRHTVRISWSESVGNLYCIHFTYRLRSHSGIVLSLILNASSSPPLNRSELIWQNGSRVNPLSSSSKVSSERFSGGFRNVMIVLSPIAS